MKIGVVGCGQVGAAIANGCVLRGVGSSLVLVDRNHALASAQAEDILHATPFAAPLSVVAGNEDDLASAGIIIIAAGVGQKPGETRLDLLKRNADIFAQIMPRLVAVAPEAIFIIATNPVDIMTHLAAQFVPQAAQGRVIGSGTLLDTARFRALLGQFLGVSIHSVHAHVLGEHGDSELLQWSGVTIGNTDLANFSAQMAAPITENIRAQIDDGVRRAAYRIIAGKGATCFGIGAGVARLAQAIVDNESAVLTCCIPLPEIVGIKNVTLSLPHVVDRSGVRKTIMPQLDAGEETQLQHSAQIIRDALASLGL